MVFEAIITVRRYNFHTHSDLVSRCGGRGSRAAQSRARKDQRRTRGVDSHSSVAHARPRLCRRLSSTTRRPLIGNSSATPNIPPATHRPHIGHTSVTRTLPSATHRPLISHSSARPPHASTSHRPLIGHSSAGRRPAAGAGIDQSIGHTTVGTLPRIPSTHPRL